MRGAAGTGPLSLTPLITGDCASEPKETLPAQGTNLHFVKPTTLRPRDIDSHSGWPSLTTAATTVTGALSAVNERNRVHRRR